MKAVIAIATLVLASVLSACGSTTVPGKIVEVGQSGPLLDKLYAGSLAGSKTGLTLYAFANDTKGGTTSACTSSACATKWPALTVTDASQLVPGSGAAKALGTIARTDLGAGVLQVTYDGSPLYFFSGDTSTGQINGATIQNWSLVAK